jgi:hypothetical protein
MTTFKPPRIKGEPPPGYDGPLWYRPRSTYPFDPRYPFSIPTKLGNRLYGDNSGKRIFTSGEIVDPDGNLIPPFDRPVPCKKTAKSPKHPPEFIGGTGNIISDRVYRAITSLNPSDQIFVPLDVANLDGSTERWYMMYFGSSALYNFLDPTMNDIELKTSASGSVFHNIPQWLDDRSSTRFPYLDADVVAGRNLFSSFGGAPYFSEKLIELIGDVFDERQFLMPVGVA